VFLLSKILIIIITVCGKRECLLPEGYVSKDLPNAKGDDKKRRKPQARGHRDPNPTNN